ncbi:MAG: glycosyltransferase family 4 protein, partial [Chloroflexi bacterium]|nr:glycosyltransferase family 4 protein [Chloroflexota bacterium]
MAQRPIKVMRIIARLNVGGPAIHVISLTGLLREPDFESILVCGHIDETEGDMQYLAEERGIEPVIIPTLGRDISLLRDIGTIWQLYRLIRRYRPVIVDTHTAKAGFVGRIAAWLARVPVRLHTFHGHVFHGYFGPRKTQLFLMLERLCARLSSRIITISPGLRDELVNTYHIAPAAKFVVVPLGFDLAPLTARPPRASNPTRVVGIVGRLVPIKNHKLFLDAARLLLQ